MGRNAGFRLPRGGLIDRNRPLGFRFNGRPMTGYAGDTVASALMANGVRIIGRSFKYHRPRGFFGADFEDPNAMLEIRDAFGRDPAIRAGQVRLAEDQQMSTVTGWPSVEFDLGAVAGLAQRFIKAGFYYKTFMWPGWMVYEPFVRRAAGFGRHDAEAPLRPREHRHETCDVLIVGGGPAGLATARALVGSGLDVVLAELAPAVGGSLMWEDIEVDETPGAAWAAAQHQVIGSEPGGRILTDTVVVGAYENDFFTLLQSRYESGEQGRAGGVASERLWKLRARHVVLSTGAIDRPLVFPGNDRPGIMLASAVRRYIAEYGVAPADSIAVYTNNDGGYRTALAAAKAGLSVAGVIDTRDAEPGPLAELVAAKGIHRFGASQIINTEGRKGLHTVTVAPIGGGGAMRLSCGALAVSGGATPLVHLAAHRGIKPAYDEKSSSFVCRQLPSGWQAAGGVSGGQSVAAALREGVAAANAIRSDAGVAPSGWSAPEVIEHETGYATPHWRATAGSASCMWVDLQNDVTVADVELAAREGYTSVEHLKRYTTLGMGADQGRTSDVNGIGLMAGLSGRAMGEVGTTTFRPPYTGVRMLAIAHHRQGALYRPRRIMPAHDSHVAAGAEFEDFGWQRPDWYRANGADREAAVVTEMLAVRNAVGIFDGSPLGKIEVGGPDAASFLNRFYVSNLMTLKPGRIRYSVMLREDGIIFDDGVVTCIDEGFYIAGPTSAQADAVAAWFERWRQTEWPHLRVATVPVTPNWASIALSGPRARDLLSAVEIDIDLSPEAFPHMSFRQGRVAGVPVRLSRISFTGELQYEVNVPARYGKALIDRLQEAGRPFGARLLGMEAWLRLRVEKGYLHVGSDTNGRTSPMDIGMAGIVERKKADFIGKRSLSLPYGRSEDREQLVGLKALKGQLAVGGRILAAGETAPPCRTDGYVSSACYSPTLDASIGLALIERGASRLGETVRISDRGAIIEAEICSPVFYDPENERLKQ